MRTTLSITLLFMCLLVCAQNEGTNVKQSKETHVNKKLTDMTPGDASQELKIIQKNKKSRQQSSQNFGKLYPYFWPKVTDTFDDKGLPELGDYKFTKNSEDSEKLDITLERKKKQTDQESNPLVTIKGYKMEKSKWEKYFWNSDFGEGTQVKEAQDEWKNAKRQASSINSIAPPPKSRKKEKETDAQYKQRLASQEKKYRNQIRGVGNKQVNDYLDLLETKEKEEGKMYRSAEKVKQVAEENELLGLNKLAEKFKDCIDCKI